MRERLERSGQRSISALVDISNYVMLELGRPSHVFDLSKIHGGLSVRWGRAGEQLKLLNGQTVDLGPDADGLAVGVIADQQQVESLAGIMGGDDTAVSLYFGQHVNHFHYDRMQLDLFANGQPMMPDLGYPDAMNEYVPGIYTWSMHTISHNTVTVDATPQPGNQPGIVKLLAEGRAYHCYASPEELTAMREKAKAEGKPMKYDGRWRDRDPKDAPPGVKPVVRLKAPTSGHAFKIIITHSHPMIQSSRT
jgi:hypothetical protein